MMKRFLLCFLVVALMAVQLPFFEVRCHAISFTPHDMSNFGIFTFVASCYGGENAALEESGSPTQRLSLGNGLRFLSSSGAYEPTEEVIAFSSRGSEIYHDIAISHSEQEMLVEADFSTEASRLFCRVNHPIFGLVYMITVEISLTPGEDVFERLSGLTVTYCFSASDLSCVAVTGTEIRSSVEGASLVNRISPEGCTNAYAASNGEIWDAACFAAHAALIRKSVGEDSSFRFVCRISTDDVMRTLSASDRSYVQNALVGNFDRLCVGFDLRYVVAQQMIFPQGIQDMLCVSSCLPGFSVCPASENGETWAQVLSKSLPNSMPSRLTHVLAPLYLVGNVPLSPAETPLVEEESVQNETVPWQEPLFQGTPPVVTDAPAQPEGELELIPPFSSTDDDFLEKLPDVEDLPSETEILYSKGEEGYNGTVSILSTTLLLGAGILLFCSVVGAAIIFRAEDKKTKKTKKH